MSLAYLREAVGPSGRVLGVDDSQEMDGVAQQQIRSGALADVEILRATVGEVELPDAPDVVLLAFTHELLPRPEDLQNVLCQCRAGCRVAAVGVGVGVAQPWHLRTDLKLSRETQHMPSRIGLLRAWRHLARQLDGVRREHGPPGTYYVTGTVAEPEARR